MMTRRHKITVPIIMFFGLKNDGVVVVVVVSTGCTRYKDEIPDDGNDDTPDGGKGSTGAVVSVVAKEEIEEFIKLPFESYRVLVSIISIYRSIREKRERARLKRESKIDA